MAATSKLDELLETFQYDRELLFHVAVPCQSPSECICIKRVMHAMKYYSQLIVEHCASYTTWKNKWMLFVKQTYTSLLDDYIHVLEHHNHELESIEIECHQPDCKLLLRNYRLSSTMNNETKNQDEEDNDADFLFYQNIIDTIHCYLCHSFDIGMRIRKGNETSPQTAHDVIHKMVKQRFGSSNKFNLQVNVTNTNQSARYNDETYMDDLFEYLKEHCFFTKSVDSLIHYLLAEEYDTDAVINDVEENIMNIGFEYTGNSDKSDTATTPTKQELPDAVAMCICGTPLVKRHVHGCYASPINVVECDICQKKFAATSDVILLHCPNQYSYFHPRGFDACMECIQKTDKNAIHDAATKNRSLVSLIKQYVRCSQLSSNSFEVGYRFFYWKYYTLKNKRINDHKQPFYNRFDNGGYEPHELNIRPKYDNIKDEALNNKFCRLSLKQFLCSITKANEYGSSDFAKRTNSRVNLLAFYDIYPQYETAPGQSITAKHLLSVILYTDWTDLCTAFSRTFRRLKPYQNILSIKENNAEFAHWSRLLRETVELFGQNGHDTVFRNGRLEHTAIGPFYCGVSTKIVVPHFNIRLCAPTSTSMQYEVAASFAGDNGMVHVIELNNDSTVSRELRLFNCSWISNHSAEDERLHFGGAYPIRIANIQNVRTRIEYRRFLAPLYHFHALLHGALETDIQDGVQQRKQCKVIHNLIQHYLHTDGYKNKYNEYVNDMFEAFVNAQTQVVLNMNSYEPMTHWQLWDFVVEPRDYELHRIRDTLFRLFKNMKKLMIYSNIRLLNVSHLLFTIQSLFGNPLSHELEVVIEASGHSAEHSWIESQYQILTAQKTLHHFDIQFAKQPCVDLQHIDKLVIICGSTH